MNVAVLGAGSWGTTLAVHLANKGERVRLWEVSQELAQALIRQRENVKFLPSIRIPESVFISSSLDEVIGETEVVVIAVPSSREELMKTDSGIRIEGRNFTFSPCRMRACASS